MSRTIFSKHVHAFLSVKHWRLKLKDASVVKKKLVWYYHTMSRIVVEERNHSGKQTCSSTPTLEKQANNI